MRPSLIPDDEIPEGSRRVTIMPPGDPLESTIMPVEALVTPSKEYETAPGSPVMMFTVRCMLEDGDIEKLRAGAPVFITFFENIVPFDVRVG